MSHWYDWIPTVLNVILYAIGQFVGHKQGSQANSILTPETVSSLVQTAITAYPPAQAPGNEGEPTAPETPSAKTSIGPTL